MKAAALVPIIFTLFFSTVSLCAEKSRPIGEMGQDKGNGAELGSERLGTISWFGGTKTVNYCFDIAPDFPVDRGTLERKVQAVIEQWVQMVRTSDLYYFKEILKDLALDFRLIPSCGFGEDIKFYFGSSSAEVEAARKSFRNPLALAQQTSLDKETARSKGFIWLTPQGSLTKVARERETRPSKEIFPDWRKDYQLHAILLHEIGHVFGADHIGGTIMSKWIAHLMTSANAETYFHKLGTDYLYHINHQRMVLAPVTNSYEFPGRLGNNLFPPEVRSPHSGDTKGEDVFELLLGRKAKGAIKAKAHFTSDHANSTNLRLTVTDDLNSREFVFAMDDNRSEFWILDGEHSSGITVGRFRSSYGYHGVRTGSDKGRTYTGSLRTAAGKTLQIMAQMNMQNQNYLFTDNGPLLIGFLDKDKKWKFLFHSNLIYQTF